MKTIREWKSAEECGSIDTNIVKSNWIGDWFVGYGYNLSDRFAGTWWDMICFARNVLASENTKLAAPQYYTPGWATRDHAGEEKPYIFDESGGESE